MNASPVNLPHELRERVRRVAREDRQVSANVDTALERYHEREGLGDILADWHAEIPIPDEVLRQAGAELDGLGWAGLG